MVLEVRLRPSIRSSIPPAAEQCDQPVSILLRVLTGFLFAAW